MFILTDKVTNEINPIGFSLGYYESYKPEGDEQASGPYVFRPKDHN